MTVYFTGSEMITFSEIILMPYDADIIDRGWVTFNILIQTFWGLLGKFKINTENMTLIYRFIFINF